MESALKTCEIEFKKITNDLQVVLHRLEAEFAEQEARPDTSLGVNPLKVFRRVSKIQTELPAVQRRAEAVMTEKARLLRQLHDLASSTQANLTFIAQRAGVPIEAMPQLDQMRALVEAAGAPAAIAPSTGAAGGGTAVVDTENVAPTHSEKAYEPVADAAGEEVEEEDPYADIPEDVFKSVPASIRGRCKLADVNKAFHVIVEHFKSELEPPMPRKRGRARQPPAKPALTVRDLHKLGAKVSGLSGECVLNTLRHLGKIQSSKAGVRLAMVASRY